MKSATLIVGLCLWLAVGAVVAVHAQGDTWRVTSAIPLGELLPSGVSLRGVFLSPSADRVAYAQRSERGTLLCAAALGATEPSLCLDLQDEGALGLVGAFGDPFAPLAWSSDGTRAAVVGSPLRTLRDTDLTLVDFATREVRVLADDGYEGNLLNPAEGLPLLTVELQPVFSPDGAQLAVERTVFEADAVRTTIAIFDLASGKVRDVAELPGHEQYERDVGSVIGMAWSPDGATLAVSLRRAQPDSLYAGVWLLDVADGTWTPALKLAQLGEALRAAGVWASLKGDALATALRWSPGGARLLFKAWSPASALSAQPVWLELETGALTVPLGSIFADRRAFPPPVGAQWSPDGRALLLGVRVSEATDDAPLLLGEAERYIALWLVDVAEESGTLLGYLPDTGGVPLGMVWANTRLILGGYVLELAQE